MAPAGPASAPATRATRRLGNRAVLALLIVAAVWIGASLTGRGSATVGHLRYLLELAAVMLRAGQTRLILANEVGGAGGAGRLAALLEAWPRAEVYVFADSTASVAALAAAWSASGLPQLRVLAEVGAARGGARTDEARPRLSSTPSSGRPTSCWRGSRPTRVPPPKLRPSGAWR